MPVVRKRAIELIGVLFCTGQNVLFFFFADVTIKKQWAVLITQGFSFSFESIASRAAEVCRGSIPLSDDSVQEPVILESTLQCAAFCYTHAAS